MIRQFYISDLKKIKENRFSGSVDAEEAFSHADYFKNSLVDDAGVLCIIAFRCYWGKNYQCFLTMSDRFNALHARELKRFVDDAMHDFGADRLQTDSIAHPVLDRWHQFFGFELEGTRKKLLYGQDFRMWAKFPKGA